MALKQLFYTSCVNKAPGGTSGFQVKAASPSLGQEERETLQGILGYRIPRNMAREQIESHPAALRYQPVDATHCYLLCSRSCGADEMGRPGNFFAHCLAGPADAFAGMAPILYWRHPFWQREDTEERTVLPELPSLPPETSFDFESIWPFLDFGRRREWFAALLGALVRFERDRRAIVIVDTVDGIASWIACLTFALPARFRALLSFATYHHDPYQAPFTVIGTSADGGFRCSEDDYVSYFILNVPAGRISAGNACSYATLVAPWMTPQRYESELLTFFEFCDVRAASGAPAWDDLDRVADIYVALRQPERVADTARMVAVLEPVLSSLERMPTLSAEQLEDLRALTTACRAQLPAGKTVSLYVRCLKLVARAEAGFAGTASQELEGLLEMASVAPAADVEKVAAALLDLKESLYEQASLSPQLIESKSRQLSSADRLRLAWSTLTPVMRRAQLVAPEWFKSLVAVTLTYLVKADPARPAAGDARKSLLACIGQTLKDAKERRYVLDVFAQGHAPTDTFLELYVALIQRTNAEERDSLRTHVSARNPALSLSQLHVAELKAEVAGASPEKLRGVLERAISRWKPFSGAGDELLEGVIDSTLRSTGTAQAASAVEILQSEALRARLTRAFVARLAGIAFQNQSPRALNHGQMAVARAFQADDGVSAELQTILTESIAMTTGEMNARAGDAIAKRLAGLDAARYKEEASGLVRRFFKEDVSVEAHVELLKKVYVRPHQEDFWPVYWDAFREATTSDQGAAHAIQILNFWFEKSLRVLAEHPYIAPQFFLQLPEVLGSIVKEARSKVFLKALGSNRAGWQATVAPLVQEKSSRLFGFFSGRRE